MYSRWYGPVEIGKVTIKEETPPPLACYQCEKLVAATWDAKTWLVIERATGVVEAMFYAEPNSHGWSASEAHAKSYILRADKTFNPFELDSVP